MKVMARLAALFGIATVLGALAALRAKGQVRELPAADADEIRLSAILEPIAFRSTAKQFRGGTLECWYGGGVVDLRDATLDPGGARLVVRAIFGGAQILVPEEWRVISTVRGIGGLGDSRPRRERPADARILSIEGFALFGGFALASTISEEEVRGLREAMTRFGRFRHTAASEA